MAGEFEGKVVLVTGAARGIGRATALALARGGAAVGVNYARSREAAHRLVAEIERAGGRAVAVPADVSRPEAVSAMVEAVRSRFGPVDVLVNNAGVFHPGRGETLDWAQWREMVAVNVEGILHCVRAVAPGMAQRRSGAIVNIASIAAFGTTMADTTPYALTKAAVVALTKRLALELGPDGITVNAVCPGFIETEMAMQGLGATERAARLADLARRTVLGRVGQPEDVAAAVLYLAGAGARFVTGQALTVDGGRTDFLSRSG